MITLPQQFTEIKQYHTMSGNISNWSTGLNNGGKMPGSKLDKLRTNLTDDNLKWMFDTIDNIMPAVRTKGPFSNQFGEQWEIRREEFGQWFMFYNTNGSISDYIKQAKPGYQDLRKILWSIVTMFCEMIENIEYKVHTLETKNKYNNLIQFEVVPFGK